MKSQSFESTTDKSPSDRRIQSDEYSPDAWESAYLRFETSEQEIRKFVKRLFMAGAARWPGDAEIAELFCGRGNGLHALRKIGFSRLMGIDLSFRLLTQYKGSAKVCVCDCRELNFKDQCKDIVIIQGGSHHLSTFPDDLERTLCEIHRILKSDGLLVLVEPWLTPFLSFVHAVCRNKVAKSLSRKIESLATMIFYEQRTYEQWLSQPEAILDLLRKYFQAERCSLQWGKLIFIGRRKAAI